MEYQSVDHAPFWSCGGWPETTERWKKEGYDPDRLEPASVTDRKAWFGGWFHPNPPFERKVVQEDADHIVYINHEGILMKEMKNNPYSSMPQFLKFPVATREEFRTFWKERMQSDLAARIGPDWKTTLKDQRARPVPFIIISDRWGGFFGPLRNFMGVENLCLAFYDQPSFVERMMEQRADLMIAVTERILEYSQFEVFWFWEDMACKHGPLIGPDLYRRFAFKHYRRVCDFLRGRGVEHIWLDSDGDIHSLIPIWMDAGINGLWPFEVQAGMDVLEIRETYGHDLVLAGGINKRTVAIGGDAMRAEVDRVMPLVQDGGYLPEIDHSAPPDISWPNYCEYMEYLMGRLGRG